MRTHTGWWYLPFPQEIPRGSCPLRERKVCCGRRQSSVRCCWVLGGRRCRLTSWGGCRVLETSTWRFRSGVVGEAISFLVEQLVLWIPGELHSNFAKTVWRSRRWRSRLQLHSATGSSWSSIRNVAFSGQQPSWAPKQSLGTL